MTENTEREQPATEEDWARRRPKPGTLPKTLRTLPKTLPGPLQRAARARTIAARPARMASATLAAPCARSLERKWMRKTRLRG